MKALTGREHTGVLEAQDPDTLIAQPVGIDTETKTLRVGSFVWDAAGMRWVKMTQPGLRIDEANLNVSMGDVEKLLAENYWAQTRFDWTSGNLDYKGYNISATALSSATDWLIAKYTWDVSSKPIRIQVLQGSWSSKANLNW